VFASVARIGALGLAMASCRPDAEGGPTPLAECDDDAGCADGQHCQEGRCRAQERPAARPLAPAAALGGDGGVPKLRWDVAGGAAISTTPVLHAGQEGEIAVVGTHAGRVLGVLVDGESAGRLVLDLHVDGIVWSSPLAPGDGRVYFGADDDRLYAVDMRTAMVAWRMRLGDCTPARAPGPEGTRCDVDGGPVAAPGGDLYVGADGLYRIGTDGTVRWHYPAGEAGARDAPSPHVASTPVVTESIVVFGGHDGFVTALDHDGGERWRFSVGADVDGSPVVAADGTIVVGADGGRISALDPDDGSLRWAFAAEKDVRSGIARGPDDTLFATSLDGRLYALGPGGRVRFIVPTEGPIASTPVIDAAGNVFFGSRDDRLYAVASAGEVLWNVELPDDIDGGVAISSAGTIVVGCDDGHLRGLR
jgi:outer membrane protein assembly factor BamB